MSVRVVAVEGQRPLGSVRLNVDERVALREVVRVVDHVPVAPQRVQVVADETLDAVLDDEVAGIARGEQCAVEHVVDRHVAARDAVAMIEAAAPAAVDRRRAAGQDRLQVIQEVGVELRLAVRQDRLAGGVLRVDVVPRIGPDRAVVVGGDRQDAVADDQAHADRLDVIAGQVDVEVERLDRHVGPDDHVRQDAEGLGVVDREERVDAARIGDVDFEVRQQQCCRRSCRDVAQPVVDRGLAPGRGGDQGQTDQELLHSDLLKR